MILPLITVFAHAQIRSNLYLKPEPPPKIKTAEPQKKLKRETNQATAPLTENGSLPRYFVNRANFQASENPITLPQNKQYQSLTGLNIGDVLNAEIAESLFAFAESKTPIRAIVKVGAMSGAVLIGEASLEKNSKRILIEFKKIKTSQNQIYTLVANALDERGILGVEGKLVSTEGKYFTAEMLSALAAGFADSSVSRDQNAIGNYVEKPGLDTQSKKAAVQALAKTSDRFAEKLKTAPEYSILEGPINIQILITDQPKQDN